jgi:8-oxo-dGTP diphosphatase
MARGDGNGWVECRCGHRHWGLFGAAGLLLVRTRGGPQVLMQLRAPWTHEGGRWGLPGGARDSHETVAAAAVREAGEEAGVEADHVRVMSTAVGADHGIWSYTYVIAMAEPGLRVGPPNAESDQLAWVGLDDVAALPLHSGLASAWVPLRPVITSVLDTAAAG